MITTVVEEHPFKEWQPQRPSQLKRENPPFKPEEKMPPPEAAENAIDDCRLKPSDAMPSRSVKADSDDVFA